jgi:hypothetical protein
MQAPTASEIGNFAQEFSPAEEPHCSPMSFGQLRIWFVEQLAMGATINNLFFAVQLSGELHQSALDLSFKVVVNRHEVLRTTLIHAMASQFK